MRRGCFSDPATGRRHSRSSLWETVDLPVRALQEWRLEGGLLFLPNLQSLAVFIQHCVEGRGARLSSCGSRASTGITFCPFMPSVRARLLLPSQGETCPLGEFDAKGGFCSFSSKCWYRVFGWLLLVEERILVLISAPLCRLALLYCTIYFLWIHMPNFVAVSCIFYLLYTHFSCWNFTGSCCSWLLFSRPHCLQLLSSWELQHLSMSQLRKNFFLCFF